MARKPKGSLKLPQLMLATCGSTTLITLIIAMVLEDIVFDKGLSTAEILAFGALFIVPSVVMFYVGKHLQVYALNYIAQANKLAEGDLRVSFDQDSICWCFNTQAKALTEAASSLRTLANTTSQVSDRVEGSVNEINQEMSLADELVNISANEINQVAGAIGELTSRANEITTNVDQCVEMSKSANLVSKKSTAILQSSNTNIYELKTALDGALQNVKSLDEMSKSIDSISGEIQAISEQTNLLALNAAIEAARAGEAGRGFAVVADEVRTLSQRTAESTTNIQSTIGDVQASVLAANKVVSSAHDSANEVEKRSEEILASFDDLNGAITNLNSQIERISGAASQQMQVTSEISKSIEAIHENSESVTNRLSEMNSKSNNAIEGTKELSYAVSSFNT